MKKYETYLEKISEKIKKEPENTVAHDDLLSVCKAVQRTDREMAVKWLRWQSDRLEKTIPKVTDNAVANKLVRIHREVLKTAAQDDFDSYMLFLEWDREP